MAKMGMPLEQTRFDPEFPFWTPTPPRSIHLSGTECNCPLCLWAGWLQGAKYGRLNGLKNARRRGRTDGKDFSSAQQHRR